MSLKKSTNFARKFGASIRKVIRCQANRLFLVLYFICTLRFYVRFGASRRNHGPINTRHTPRGLNYFVSCFSRVSDLLPYLLTPGRFVVKCRLKNARSPHYFEITAATSCHLWIACPYLISIRDHWRSVFFATPQLVTGSTINDIVFYPTRFKSWLTGYAITPLRALTAYQWNF